MTTTRRLRIDRPLTDPERSLITYLAVRTVADQLSVTEEVAADALDTFSERGLVHLRGNSFDVYLDVDGHVLVHCARDWLSFMTLAVENGEPVPDIGRPIE